jgi:translation elongation factor EF-1alpha
MLMDKTKDEQEGGISIVSSEFCFDSEVEKRSCVVMDAPGRREFSKNMIETVFKADAAVLVYPFEKHDYYKDQRQKFTKKHLNILKGLEV